MAQYIASPIVYDTPDVLGALSSGYSTGMGIREDIRNVKKRAESEAMTAPALEAYRSGDQAALAQIAQYNPELAKSLMGVEEFKQKGALNNLAMEETRQQMAFRSEDQAMQRERLSMQKAALAQQAQMQQIEQAQKAQAIQEEENLLDIRREFDVGSRVLAQMDKIEDPDQAARFWQSSLDDAEKNLGINIPDELQGSYTPEKKMALQNYLMQADTLYGFTKPKDDSPLGSKYMEDARIISEQTGIPLNQAYAMAKSGTGVGQFVDPTTGQVSPMAGYVDTTTKTNLAVKAAEKTGAELGKTLVEKRDAAIMAQNSLAIGEQAQKLIDDGMFTGKFADLRMDAAKILGVSPEEIANTETFSAIMARSVGENISQFGSGTAISDADRAFVQKMVGGEISLNKDSLKRILDINKRTAQKTISNYEQLRANPYSTELPTQDKVSEKTTDAALDPIEAELKRRGL